MTARLDAPDQITHARTSVAAPAPGPAKGGGGWKVNLDCASAVHDRGLTVSFVALPIDTAQRNGWSGQTAVDLCWAPAGLPVWAVMADEDTLQAALCALAAADDLGAAKTLKALTQGAGAAWIEALTERERAAASHGGGVAARALDFAGSGAASRG